MIREKHQPGAAAHIRLTHRRVLRIAWPIVLSNATVPLLGIVDTGVIGQLGQAAPIGAVGVGAVVLTAIYWIFGFLRMGTSGLTAQARGAGDTGEVAAMLTRALLIGAMGGVLVVLVHVPLFAGALALAPASAEVEMLALQYMSVRVWSAPAMIAMFGMTGWLIAMERTGAVLIIQLVMNGLNIVLNLWFVLGLEWGVSGVAWATFTAEWAGVICAFFMCRDAFRVPDWCNWALVFDLARLRRMASVNTDILIRSALLEVVMLSFIFLASDLGDVTLAANQVLVQFLHVSSYIMDGFAFAAEALVGQAVGARAAGAVRRASILTSQWGVGAGIVLALCFGLFGGAAIDTLAASDAVREAGRSYLPWLVAAPIFGAAAWMLDGIFIGATRTRDMRNMMIVSLAVYGAAVAVLMPLFGNHGLWAALLIAFAVRGITLGMRYPALERSAE
ncbi:MATE family efflux transporter [Roseovarius arcticus]|uniref:MATE family efflux transporter n=1 Tax=Roseovarius arcticus TaxID=2547404 RepID=UPI001FE6CB28|nr:MATE family efflux transporter [Roseovarius arcticus]